MPDKTAAIMPPEFIKPTISGMNPGEVKWAVPWSMWIDEDHRAYLHPGYGVEDKAAGTVSMKIEKTEAGYFVEINPEKWNVGCHFAGETNQPWIPVREIKIR